MRQRGFSLIEVIIVVAIVITVATFVLAASSGARPYAARSAATQFDAALAYGRALAATSGNGATLLFTPGRAGFAISFYSGRPTAAGALRPAAAPPMAAQAEVHEASVGPPPFALFLNSAGHATLAAVAAGTPAPMSAEPPCPPGGSWTLTFADGRRQEERVLPCFAAISAP